MNELSAGSTRAGLFAGFERGIATLPDASIAYVMGGTGPPLLLLHGFPQTLAMWARVAPTLSREFTVVCADLRGYGDSSKPEDRPDHANYSFRALADDQVALMAQLGFHRFDLVGHDRGARTAHRLALDHPQRVSALALLDIVPTYTMITEVDHRVASGYWHWYFLAQPHPFPERLIQSDPDYFFEQCLFGWGAARAEDFDPDMLRDYRRCWRDPKMIHGSCADYRAAGTVDWEHDRQDLHEKVRCPALALWGSKGLMHQYFDIGAEWRKRCEHLRTATLPGGHFLVDQFPEETAAILGAFLRDRDVGAGLHAAEVPIAL